MSSWKHRATQVSSWRPPSHTEHSAMNLFKSSGDNRMISQNMSKLMHTLTIKDQDIPIPDTTLTHQQRHTLLLNSLKQTTPTTRSSLSGDKTLGKLAKEEYTTNHLSAGGLNQTLSTQTTYPTFKRPVSLLLLQQLPQHFNSFLPAPTPQIIQP